MKVSITTIRVELKDDKIIRLREIIAKAPLHVLCVDETKSDDSFSNSQFVLENFHFPPFRRDRNSKGGGNLVYVKQ